jgi:hypothetical protein
MATALHFTDLPLEIHYLIYEHVFQESKIELKLPVALRNKHYWTTCPTNRSLPGILMVSKVLRAECLQLFLASALSEVYLYARKNLEVPEVFYSFARIIVLKGWKSWMPFSHLKMIVIEDQNDQDIWAYMDDRYGLSDMELAQNVCRKLQEQKDFLLTYW